MFDSEKLLLFISLIKPYESATLADIELGLKEIGDI
jgi:hypothetical protein